MLCDGVELLSSGARRCLPTVRQGGVGFAGLLASATLSARGWLELGSALYSLHPAFGEARVLRLSAALRPALDDHRPAVVLRDGVWHINGLYRHGYLCAPAVVDELAHKLLAL